MTQNTKISALAIILNEEDNIREYLKNMSFADEIVVVDSYSNDKTLEIIAAEFPKVKVFQRRFDDFSNQRNFALEKASNEWVTFFDADERITEKGIQEIQNKVDLNPTEVAFWIKRTFYYEEKPFLFEGKNKNKAIRLFRKSKCHYSDKLVHEQLIVNGQTGILKEILHHFSFKNKEDFTAKNLQYSKLKAQELFPTNLKPGFLHFYIKPTFRFLKHFIIQLGFLNGMNGFQLAKIMSFHVYMRYKYLEEMYTKQEICNELIIGYEAKRVFHNKTGLGNYSRDLIRILSHYYPENKYYLYNPKPQKNTLFKTNEKTVFEKLPVSKFGKKFYNIWRQYSIVSDLKKDRISIFHGLSGELPSGLKKANIKSIVTIHDLIFMRYPQFYSFFDRKIHYHKFKKAAHQSDLIIAISEQTKRDIIKYLSVDASKIKVIYQGCQAIFKETFADDVKDEVVNKFNLPQKFILNVGTIESRKNVLSVVKSIKNIDITLVIVGSETPYVKEVKSYIEANNLTNKVLFLKGLNSKELATLYQLATIFIYPSLFEGFGIPIIEALYSKTAVITSKNGVFPEAGGPNSIYVNPLDIEEIGDKIKLLLTDEYLRNDMAKKGFEFVQKFNDDNIASEMMKTYKSL